MLNGILDLSKGKAVFCDKENKDQGFSVIFCGDLCVRGRSTEKILSGESEDILSEVMPSLNENDISVVNVENPFSNNGSPR